MTSICPCSDEFPDLHLSSSLLFASWVIAYTQSHTVPTPQRPQQKPEQGQGCFFPEARGSSRVWCRTGKSLLKGRKEERWTFLWDKPGIVVLCLPSGAQACHLPGSARTFLQEHFIISLHTSCAAVLNHGSPGYGHTRLRFTGSIPHLATNHFGECK